ncbi:MAG: hypothetical protein M1828_000059 [Chrysothrix sp. TS-e1954]|nr:MAG: hypothetical protein M1828_000059 [Chrysothrix sp. TS-e1954]
MGWREEQALELESMTKEIEELRAREAELLVAQQVSKEVADEVADLLEGVMCEGLRHLTDAIKRAYTEKLGSKTHPEDFTHLLRRNNMKDVASRINDVYLVENSLNLQNVQNTLETMERQRTPLENSVNWTEKYAEASRTSVASPSTDNTAKTRPAASNSVQCGSVTQGQVRRSERLIYRDWVTSCRRAAATRSRTQFSAAVSGRKRSRNIIQDEDDSDADAEQLVNDEGRNVNNNDGDTKKVAKEEAQDQTSQDDVKQTHYLPWGTEATTISSPPSADAQCKIEAVSASSDNEPASASQPESAIKQEAEAPGHSGPESNRSMPGDSGYPRKRRTQALVESRRPMKQ